jgi:hypothetical protein
VRGVGTIDRNRFVGVLAFVLDRPGFNFRADYGGGIPPNTVLNLSGADVTFAKEFSGVQSENRIGIVGRDAVVWYEGESVPTVIDVEGINISVIPKATDSGLSAVKIAGIAILGIVLIGVVIFGAWLYWGRKRKAKLTEYDRFTDGGKKYDQDWRESTSMVDL